MKNLVAKIVEIDRYIGIRINSFGNNTFYSHEYMLTNGQRIALENEVIFDAEKRGRFFAMRRSTISNEWMYVPLSAISQCYYSGVTKCFYDFKTPNGFLAQGDYFIYDEPA